MSEPLIELGDNVELDENSSGEPVIRHTPSGAELVYDSSASEWTVTDFAADTAAIANELGLPEYDDVGNAPQTQGVFVYGTGAGVSNEGVYRHDGSGFVQVGEWEEDGSGSIVPVDGETVGDGTTSADHQSVSAGSATIGGADVDVVWSELDSASVSNGTIEMTNIGNYDEYRLHVSAEINDPEAGSELLVRLNDLADGNADHSFFNTTGKQTGADDIAVYEFGGSIGLSSVEFSALVGPNPDNDQRVGISFSQMGRALQISDFAHWGASNDAGQSTGLNSLRIHLGGAGTFADSSEATLWGRN